MQILIMGCGRVGSTLAVGLERDGHAITVLDTDQNQFRRLPHSFKGTSIVGSGLDSGVLKEAGIERADVFIAVTQGDNRNLLASQIAKTIYNVPKVVCRVYDPIRGELYKTRGLVTISSTTIISELIRDNLRQPE